MNGLAPILHQAIREAGILPFSRFMDLALYHPVHGYYERPTPYIGRSGDFFTNVSVGPLFGALLAAQFALWHLKDRLPCLQILEAGAHDGQLAKDILSAFQSCPFKPVPAVEYWILEPSPRRQAWQQATLGEFAVTVRWFEAWEKLPASGVHGVIFANELLDAFPVRRLGWDALTQRWFEWGITAENDHFTWAKISLAEPEALSVINNLWPEAAASACHKASGLPAQLCQVLPNDFTTEICPAAEVWWRQAATALRHGHLMTIDYGLHAEQFLAPERASGTLKAYYRHHLSPDILARPGEQDITAPVNWTMLKKTGETAGLTTTTFTPQGRFLTALAQQIWQAAAAAPAWSSLQRRQFQTLIHPDHLGQAFSVLIQSR